MTDRQQQLDAHNQATNEFIELANELVNERGFEQNLVSAALMAASGVYATFAAAGNQGFLAEGGVDKVVDMYRKNLVYIQQRKKEDLEAKGLKPVPKAQADARAQSTPTGGDKED